MNYWFIFQKKRSFNLSVPLRSKISEDILGWGYFSQQVSRWTGVEKGKAIVFLTGMSHTIYMAEILQRRKCHVRVGCDSHTTVMQHQRKKFNMVLISIHKQQCKPERLTVHYHVLFNCQKLCTLCWNVLNRVGAEISDSPPYNVWTTTEPCLKKKRYKISRGSKIFSLFKFFVQLQSNLNTAKFRIT